MEVQVKISNIVLTAEISQRIDLFKLYTFLVESGIQAMDSEGFNGRITFKLNGLTIAVFHTGKIQVMGAHSFDDAITTMLRVVLLIDDALRSQTPVYQPEAKLYR